MTINRGINPWNSTLPDPALVPQFRGSWTATGYDVADVINYNQGLYIAVSATTANDLPGVSTKWTQIIDVTTYTDEYAAQYGASKTAQEALQTDLTTYKTISSKLQTDSIATLAQLIASKQALETVQNVYSIGRLPAYGDAKGTYRFNNIDYDWNGTSVSGQSQALATYVSQNALSGKTPEDFGATAYVDGATPVDSAAALQAWINDAGIGGILQTDNIYYVSTALIVSNDNVTVNWRGQLRPMPNYTGHLIMFTGGGSPKKQWGVSLWQKSVKIHALNINGLAQSKGVWFQSLDHFIIQGVQVRYTNGFGIRVESCREGEFYSCVAMLSRQGPDKGIVEFIDLADGADANNTLRVYNLHIIHNLGTHLYMDSPFGYNNGSICRLVDFFGIQVETIGANQIGDVYTDAVTFGKFDPHASYDSTVDIVKLVTVDSITFWGGHIFVAQSNLPSGGIGAGGLAVRLGSNATAGGSSNIAAHVKFNDLAAFIHDGDGTLFGLHNAGAIKLEVYPVDGLNTRPLKWINTGSSDKFVSVNPHWVTGNSAEGLFNAIGPTGQAVSGAYKMQTGNGHVSNLFAFDNFIVIQPDEGAGVLYVLRNDGAMWVQGTTGKLGVDGFEYTEVHLSSPDRSKKIKLSVNNDGKLIANDGSSDKVVTMS